MSHSWKNILVPAECTLLEALKVIDSEALRLVLVVDKERKLLGVVSDGDVRRALLKGSSLEEPVGKFMSAHPKTVSPTASREEVLSLMERLELLSVPIVENGYLLGLHTIYEVFGKPKYDNPVFLMAGGFGTRLRPLTENCPKPLLKVGDRPLLEILIMRFIKAGFYKFYISTHYLADMITDYFQDGKDWGAEIQYIHEDKPLGTCGALGLLSNEVSDLPMILMNADILTKVDFERLLNFHNQQGGDATVCVREYEHQVPYGVINTESGRMTDIVEKPKYSYHINAGIYVVEPSIYKSVEPNKNSSMPEILEQRVSSGKKVSVFPMSEYWLDIGRISDFNKAQSDVNIFGF